MNPLGIDALVRELLGDAIRAPLGARKHEGVHYLAPLEQVKKKSSLAVLLDRVDRLLDQLGSRTRPLDFDTHRVAHQSAGQRSDLARNRGAEQQRLLPLRQLSQDPPDVRQKAHVEHPIGLVQDQVLNGIEIRVRAVQVIEQSSRSRDDDVDAPAERLLLRAHLHAAEDRGDLDRCELREILKVSGYLGRELPGRSDDERAGLSPGLLHDLVQHGEQERGCLAASRLCAGEQVAPLHRRRNRLGLDRRRLLETERVDAPEQVRVKLE